MRVGSLYLIRHGEPANRTQFYGHLDVPLSPRGEQQIQQQVEAFRGAKIDAVYGSDLLRAAQGAQAIGAELGVPVTIDAALREMHLGVLEGVGHQEGRDRFPAVANLKYRDMFDRRMPDGGESVRDVADRVLPYVEHIVVEMAQRGSRGVAIYSHNTVNRLLLGVAAGAGPQAFGRFFQGYAAINRIDIDLSCAIGEVWRSATIVFSNRDPTLVLVGRDIV